MIAARKLLSGRKFLFPDYSIAVISALILLLSYLYDYPEILTKRPQGPHQWRQTDCLAFTASYYHNEAKFFQPRIYNLLNDNKGETAAEFPVLYYLIAQLWKIFGKHEWIFRLLNYGFTFLALIAMLKWFEKILKDSFWSIWSVLLLFTSVLYVYYTLNFLPNIPAFDLVLIGWYFFYCYKNDRKDYHLYLSIFLFLVAGLLKISSAISFVALSIIFLMDWTGLSILSTKEKIFPRPLKFVIPAMLALASWLAWYLYALFYNKTGNSGTMLLGIWPIWVLDREEIRNIIEAIRVLWFEDFYYPVTQFMLILMFAGIMVMIRKTRLSLGSITVLLGFGFLSYIILWFYALQYNDYYFIDLLILSVFVLLTFFDAVMQYKIGQILLNSYLIRAIALLLLVLNINHTTQRMKVRYEGWLNNLHKNELYGYEDIEQYLDSLGISRDQKIISANDPTDNASLYLMDRKGWSKYETNMKDSLKIVQRIQQGAGWLTLSHDFEGPEYSHWNYFIKEQVGQHRNLKIYRLGLPDENQP